MSSVDPPSETATLPRRGAGMYRRSLLVGVVVGLPLSFLFLYLAVRGLHPGDLADTLKRANPLKVALAVALMGVIYSVQAARWQWIARSAGALGWRTFLRLVICSLAVNNVIPGRPGELLRGYWLGRAARIPQSRAFSTVVVDRSSDVLFLIAAFAATFPFVKHPAWLQHVFVAAIVFGCLIAAALAVAGLHAGGSRLAARMLSLKLRRSWAGRQLAGLVHGAGALVNRRDALVLVLLTSIVWACWALAAWLVASGLGISLSPVELVFLTTVINLGAAIPSSPGFVGTFQWLCVSGMALFGVGQADALAFSIIMQAIWYVPTSLIGLMLLTHSGLSVWSSDGVADISSPI